MVNQLRFGRGIDNRRLKGAGFEYTYTTREATLKLAEHLRLHPVLRGTDRGYTYEREVEDFLRRSPLVERPGPERSGTESEPFGI
jgi:UDP-glucose 4-epimerase